MRTVMIAAIVLLTMMALGAVWCLSPFGPAQYSTLAWGHMAFDGNRWRAAKNWRPDNVRGKMVSSLLRRYKLVGMTRAEIVNLLGPPDGVNYSVHDDMRVPKRLLAKAPAYAYVLGAYSGFGIDYDVLTVFFDDAGRVERWGL